MEKQELEQLKENLKWQYYEKTGEKADRCKVYYNNFLDKLKTDLKHYVFEIIREHDDDVYEYFFNWEFIIDLLYIYFKEKKMTINDIKKFLYEIYNIAYVYSDKFTYLDVCLAEGLAKAIAIDIINLLF